MQNKIAIGTEVTVYYRGKFFNCTPNWNGSIGTVIGYDYETKSTGELCYVVDVQGDGISRYYYKFVTPLTKLGKIL